MLYWLNHLLSGLFLYRVTVITQEVLEFIQGNPSMDCRLMYDDILEF